MRDTKKIKYNLLFGIIGQVVTLVLGIVIPRLVLTSYGSEVNGLLASITNIYAYIAIVEAGVAAASCQALYKAIADRNRDDINGIMSATNRYYHKTGIVYLLCIIVFAIVYPIIVDSRMPYPMIVLIILFNGIGNVINYFFHGKYLILLKADGKNYVRIGVDIFTTTFKQLSKILFMYLGFDVVLVQFVAMLVSFAQMVYITVYIKKKYNWLNLKATPNYKSISQTKNVVIHQINYLVVSNTDVVILTAFSNLMIVSVYSLYILLFNMVDKILHVVKDALEFKVANCFYTNRESFANLFRAYEVYYISFSFALYSVVKFFILPFLSVYTADVVDINYIVEYLPLAFVLVKLFTTAKYPYDAMIHIAGCFKQTQNSAIIESVINIVVSLGLVHRFGIAGVLIGTIVAACYRMLYLSIYVHRHNLIPYKLSSSFKSLALNFVIFFAIDMVSGFLKLRLTSYVAIFIACIPYALAVFFIYFSVNSLFEIKSFKYLFSKLRQIVLKHRN